MHCDVAIILEGMQVMEMGTPVGRLHLSVPSALLYPLFYSHPMLGLGLLRSGHPSLPWSACAHQIEPPNVSTGNAQKEVILALRTAMVKLAWFGYWLAIYPHNGVARNNA